MVDFFDKNTAYMQLFLLYPNLKDILIVKNKSVKYAMQSIYIYIGVACASHII